MKVFLLSIMTSLPLLLMGQQGGIRLLPEAGLSLPTTGFKEQNVFADNWTRKKKRKWNLRFRSILRMELQLVLKKQILCCWNE